MAFGRRKRSASAHHQVRETRRARLASSARSDQSQILRCNLPGIALHKTDSSLLYPAALLTRCAIRPVRRKSCLPKITNLQCESILRGGRGGPPQSYTYPDSN